MRILDKRKRRLNWQRYGRCWYPKMSVKFSSAATGKFADAEQQARDAITRYERMRYPALMADFGRGEKNTSPLYGFSGYVANTPRVSERRNSPNTR